VKGSVGQCKDKSDGAYEKYLTNKISRIVRFRGSRLPGKIDYEVRYLKPQHMGKLVCDLLEDRVILAGDVPQALIRRFA